MATATLADGDIAVVEVDGETMVKRLYRTDDRDTWLLVSENKSYRPREVAEARIIGRVMQTRRRY